MTQGVGGTPGPRSGLRGVCVGDIKAQAEELVASG